MFANIVRLPQSMVAELVRDMICNLDRNGSAMTLIALKNLHPVFGPARDIRRVNPTAADVPGSIDNLFPFLCKNIPDNEISQRRVAWFLHAVAVMKVNEIAERDGQYLPFAADAWAHLIASSTALRRHWSKRALVGRRKILVW